MSKKAVLASIKPRFCELIASGEKTVEIRKNRPKIDVPFKCYIYQTKGHWIYKILEWLGLYQQKVIGECICDGIDKYEAEFTRENDCYQDIRLVWKDEDYDYDVEDYRIITSNDRENPNNCSLCRESSLSFEEIKAYIGIGFQTFYAWHISDLVIYDKPKELSEFNFPPDRYCKKGLCGGCPRDCTADVYGDYDYDCEWKRPLTRPPQSWCYVEELSSSS